MLETVLMLLGSGPWPSRSLRSGDCTDTDKSLVESLYAGSAKPYGESREWLGPARLTGQGRVGPRVRNRALRRLAAPCAWQNN
jgi:hypothetical protein